MVHTKETLLLIGKNSSCGVSGFPLMLSGPLPLSDVMLPYIKCVEPNQEIRVCL